jgi:hypothetical protein
VDLSDKAALRDALRGLERMLGVTVPVELLGDYLRGSAPHVVGYEKRMSEGKDVLAITKYMIIGYSYLAQPALEHYFDIFRAARVVALLRFLEEATRQLIDGRVENVESRIRRLIAVKDLDDFDSIFFELATASRYGEVVGFDRVAFVAEASSHKSPDLRVDSTSEMFVECKHLDRMSEATVKLTNQARDAANPLLHDLRCMERSAVIEIVFEDMPASVGSQALCDASRRALRTGNEVRIRGARVTGRWLQKRPLVDYALYPSPAYFHDRWGYEPERWHGVVPHMLYTPAGPSFLDDVEWEGVVLWRMENDDFMWKLKRLAFQGLFEGLEQLSSAGANTTLHVWFERNIGHGHRRDQLVKFVDTLEAKRKVDFGWIVLNESVSDVSLGGHFDFQEHASLIRGDQHRSVRPVVTTVFVEPDRGQGEWGVGVVLPSIDEDPRA